MAEKRAAIDAVTKRLSQQKLGELVLDLHGGVSSRRAFAQMIGQALDASRNAPRLDNGAELQRVERRREQLNAYVRCAARARGSRGACRSTTCGPSCSAWRRRGREFRFRGAAIEALGQAAARQAADDLAEYARLGGLTLRASGSPWAGSPIVSAEEARQAIEVLDDVRRHALPTAACAARARQRRDRPARPARAGRLGERDRALGGDRRGLVGDDAGVYELDLQAACEALAPAGRGGVRPPVGRADLSRYRAARAPAAAPAGAAASWPTGTCTQLPWPRGTAPAPGRASAAAGTRAPPRTLTECQALVPAPARPARPAGSLVRTAPAWPTCGPTELRAGRCDRLDADRGTLVRLPELHRLRTSLEAAGLGSSGRDGGPPGIGGLRRPGLLVRLAAARSWTTSR